MFVLRRIITVVGLAIMVTGLWTSAALAQDPEAGKVAWEEETGCQNCHGAAAEGQWAGPLAGSDKTAEEWIDQVRNPRRNMPMFSAAQVSDEQIANMQAYVSSLPAVEDFAPIDPELPADAPEGQLLLAEKRCAACHTTQGPINGFIQRGELPTAEAVMAQVREPRRNMPMFSAEQVSDAELTAITDFLAQEVAAQLPAESAPAEAEAETMENPADADAEAMESETMDAPAEQPAETAQEAPATLPVSGGSQPTPWPAMLLIAGALALVGGLVLRRATR